ncbi:adult-specific cuticular protein ACP-20-like [Palaemon carinicauda]|uniref:adult-specific cuticular protein ACP-20-like n=1 Tax=Palaemon carinicauda TaxID=392227 RepID=UPI0035B6A3E8
MSRSVLVLLAIVSLSMAHPDGYGHGGGHGGGHGDGHGGGHGYGGPIPYHFDYSVKGDYKGPNFGQNEKSDGKGNVYGSYSVALPDGRKQHVDYTADHYNGFVAKVSYSGKAQHPAYYGPAVVFDHHGDGYH